MTWLAKRHGTELSRRVHQREVLSRLSAAEASDRLFVDADRVIVGSWVFVRINQGGE